MMRSFQFYNYFLLFVFLDIPCSTLDYTWLEIVVGVVLVILWFLFSVLKGGCGGVNFWTSEVSFANCGNHCAWS